MAPQTEPIRGKIAKVLNEHEVALNVGKEQGVASDMQFDILFPEGIAIIDPDTGEKLGSVDQPKARVKIARIYDKFSVATTFRTRRVNAGGVGLGASNALGALFQPPKWEDRLETLNIRDQDEDAEAETDEQASFVAMGDVVVQVLPGGP